MPPSILLMAGCDPLRDEGKAYADRLVQASSSRPVKCYVAPGMIHGFLLFFNKKNYDLNGLQKEMTDLLNEVAGILRPWLHGPPASPKPLPAAPHSAQSLALGEISL